MNKAITDGLVLMPLPFAAGLGVWSSGDGTSGSDTYAQSGTGVFVSADQDFGGCLEVQKTEAVQRVRYMGETPILPGCYLRIRARVKAVAGPLPSVRVAGWAGKAGGGQASVGATTAPSTALSTYGEVVEVSAIVGTGDRTGVDLVWDGAAYGHFGIDLTGDSGGLVRVDDIEIEDITSAFLRDMMAMVDVRDFGARGDGTGDDGPAFAAADAAANGREILVPAGVYRLDRDVTIDNPIRFEGRVTQARAHRLILQHGFGYQLYLDAFGDEEEAFRKAYQALLNFADHESLDLGGRRIRLTGPVDMQGCDPARDRYEIRRVIRNGQFEPQAGPAWDTVTTTSQARYSPSDKLTLTEVTNVANVPVGALVTGNGVGREVYVRARDIAARTLTLNAPLFDASGTQTYTFQRFAYLLDFSGYEKLSQFILDDIEFQCAGEASGILLAPAGLTFHLRDCFVNRPKDRGLTSPGRGCQGMMVDRCQFISNEQSELVQDRRTIALNARANDVKLRDNRVSKFKHFCLLGGTGNLITGNHWFHGDGADPGVRRGGIILTTANCATVISGNYIDNNFIEWTNEYETDPDFGNQYSFGGLTITANLFLASDVGAGFSFIVVKPYGSGQYIHGLTVTANSFRMVSASINRVEDVDTSYADLDFSRMRQVTFAGNTFNGVNRPVSNPASLVHDQNTAAAAWIADSEPHLPFRGWARFVDAVQADGPLRTSGGAARMETPWADTTYGGDKRKVRFVFDSALTGRLRYTVRMDNPN